MIRIGICDDMLEEIMKQKGMVERIAGKLGFNIEVQIFEEGDELLQYIQRYGHIDILLLDVAMRGKNGIETARIIRETDLQTLLIFVSAYDAYFKEMIEVQPFAFLEKPVAEKKLDKVLRRALDMTAGGNERFLFSSQKHRYSIALAEVMYFESLRRQICIHCTDDTYIFYGKLNAVEKETAGASCKFVRVHVSYIVNLSHIRKWDYDRVVMDDGEEIPISKKYRKEMKYRYIELLEKD